MRTSKRRENLAVKKQTLGTTIASLRKEKGMTQMELAEQLGVTDKAVSKWERDLSCPDVNSLPTLAKVLGISVDDLMQCKIKGQNTETSKFNQIVSLILKVVPLAMGVSVVVLSILKEITIFSGFSMLGIGIFCLALLQIQDSDRK